MSKTYELLRSDIRSTKKQIIAENMKLTDAQAEKFWPVYDAYTQETTKLGDARYALIKEYANHYEDMTDAQAESLVNKMATLDEQTATLRQQWIPKFREGAYWKTDCVVLPIGPAHHSAAGSAVCRKHSDCQVAHCGRCTNYVYGESHKAKVTNMAALRRGSPASKAAERRTAS